MMIVYGHSFLLVAISLRNNEYPRSASALLKVSVNFECLVDQSMDGWMGGLMDGLISTL